MEEYARARRPVVLTDALSRCAAGSRWTPEFFLERYGDASQEIDGRSWTIAHYLHRMSESTPARPAPYPFSFDIGKSFPELLQDIRELSPAGPWERSWSRAIPRRFLSRIREHEIIFGAKGNVFPVLHYDILCLDSHLTQIYGEKEFILFSPDQAAYLYPRADNPKFSGIENFIDPDFERYPAFRHARPVTVTLREGETLYFPTGWWHYTRIHGPCITYGAISLHAWNWDGVVGDFEATWRQYHPKLAGAMAAAARMLGRGLRLREALVGRRVPREAMR